MVDRLSKVVDELTLRMLALRRGSLVLLKDSALNENLSLVLNELCREKVCLVRVTANDFEGSLLVYRGAAITVYSKVGELELSGSLSLKEILSRLQAAEGRVMVYEIPPEEFASNYPDVVKQVEESLKPRLAIEVPTPASPREEWVNLSKELTDAARVAGLPVSSTTVVIDGESSGKSLLDRGTALPGESRTNGCKDTPRTEAERQKGRGNL